MLRNYVQRARGAIIPSKQAEASPKDHSRVRLAFTRAIEKYDKVLARDPSNTLAHEAKAIALLRLGHAHQSRNA